MKRDALLPFTVIGRALTSTLDQAGDFGFLMWSTVSALPRRPFRIRETVMQFYFIANQSAVIIAFCVSFAAMVTIIEASFHMKLLIQNDEMVPGFAALLILRELGTVLTALLLTSRVGAGITAEIGSMNVTEQIDALKMLGIDPVRFLVIPRFVACFLAGIVLSVLANSVCLLAAYFVSSQKLGYSVGTFLVTMSRFVSFQDLIFSMIKGGVFGAVIPLVSCYYGFNCQAGAEGVGTATTKSVVTSTVAVIALDFVLSFIFSHFYK